MGLACTMEESRREKGWRSGSTNLTDLHPAHTNVPTLSHPGLSHAFGMVVKASAGPLQGVRWHTKLMTVSQCENVARTRRYSCGCQQLQFCQTFAAKLCADAGHGHYDMQEEQRDPPSLSVTRSARRCLLHTVSVPPICFHAQKVCTDNKKSKICLSTREKRITITFFRLKKREKSCVPVEAAVADATFDVVPSALGSL